MEERLHVGPTENSNVAFDTVADSQFATYDKADACRNLKSKKSRSATPRGKSSTKSTKPSSSKGKGDKKAPEKLFLLELMTDYYPDETAWEVFDVCGQESVLVFSGGPYTDSERLTVIRASSKLVSSKYELRIYDEYDDGLCCADQDCKTCVPTYFSVAYGDDCIVPEMTFDDDEIVIEFGICL